MIFHELSVAGPHIPTDAIDGHSGHLRAEGLYEP